MSLGVGLVLGVAVRGAEAADGRKPDLVVSGVTYKADCEAMTMSIRVEVENEGRSAAGAFAVGLWVDGVRLQPRYLNGLDPGATNNADWTFPYHGGQIFDREHADIRDHVRESVETNNSSSDIDEFCVF